MLAALPRGLYRTASTGEDIASLAVAQTDMNQRLQTIINQLRPGSNRNQSVPWQTPHGGLALTRNKPGLPVIGEPIHEIALPDQLILPLLDYSKQRVETQVQVGSTVTAGDVLAPGVLASASGTISAIAPHDVIHPSHQRTDCIVIEVNHDAQQSTRCLPVLSEQSLERIVRAGITGLGGAGFTTASKLMATSKKTKQINTLVVNAVECEPFISCDEALIRSDVHGVVSAILAMAQFTNCQRCIVAIEEDKVEAVAQLQHQLSETQDIEASSNPVELALLSAIYPSGAEPVLLQRIFGKLPYAGQRASDQGVLCLNVATVFAAWQAQSGQPLLSRIITIAGEHADNPTNVRVRFGTSVSHVLQQTDNLPGHAANNQTIRVRAGGPLSGFDLKSLTAPITATTNCISVEPAPQHSTASACIRCSQCSDVCPVDLLPQQLLWHASSDDLPGAMHFGLDTCIECGCCDMVCPSFIELTSTFRYARSAWKDQQQQKAAAEFARVRFEQHEARALEREREAKRVREQKKSRLASTDDAIAQALARSRARKKSS